MHDHLTKYRRKLFSKAVIKDLKEIFNRVCNDFEAILKECDGEEDKKTKNTLHPTHK